MELLEGDLFVRVARAAGIVELTPRDVSVGLRRSVREALDATQTWFYEQDQPVRLVLDLSEVHGFCSTEFGLLVGLLDSVRARDGVLRLCCLDPDLREIFRFTRLDQVFPIDRDLVESRRALEEPGHPKT
jgi:anti-sigma B factor antagonist